MKTEKFYWVAYAEDCYVAWRSVRLTRREAMDHIARTYPGGWEEARKSGWRVGKVRIVPVEAPDA